MEGQADPLGVRESTRRVMEQASQVTVDAGAAAAVARRIAGRELTAPEWDEALHPTGDRERTANYILVLDALNFCFWGEPRWRVTYRGRTYNGYWALAVSLKRAVEAGAPLHDADYLRRMDEAELARLLAGEGEIPLLAERVGCVQEVGRLLAERYDGRFSRAIEDAGGSAARLVQTVVTNLASFRDVASYRGIEARFYKRAQILASDLFGAFGGRDLGAFDDLAVLTAFADYKVPQVLHQLGVLRYAPALAARLDARQELPAGSEAEVEIRAATVVAVEEIGRALAELGAPQPAYRIDWALWELGQHLPPDARPYHRTRTIYY